MSREPGMSVKKLMIMNAAVIMALLKDHRDHHILVIINFLNYSSSKTTWLKITVFRLKT